MKKVNSIARTKINNSMPSNKTISNWRKNTPI